MLKLLWRRFLLWRAEGRVNYHWERGLAHSTALEAAQKDVDRLYGREIPSFRDVHGILTRPRHLSDAEKLAVLKRHERENAEKLDDCMYGDSSHFYRG